MTSPYTEALGDTLIERTRRERIVLSPSRCRRPRTPRRTRRSTNWPLLADTAGADAVARIVQRRERPDPATFVGKGKAQEMKDVCLAVDADTVVFDNEPSHRAAAQPEKLPAARRLDRPR